MLAPPSDESSVTERIARALLSDDRFRVRRAGDSAELEQGLRGGVDIVLGALTGAFGSREIARAIAACSSSARLVAAGDCADASEVLAAIRDGAADVLLASDVAAAPHRIALAASAARGSLADASDAKELARYRRFFETGPVIIFRWRASAGWPVETVSPNAEQLFGIPAADFISGAAPYAASVHPDDLERVGREVLAHSESGVGHFDQEYRIIRPDGEVRWLYDHTVIARDELGVITHYEGYVFDVTQLEKERRTRAAAERGLIQAQKFESLGVLAGGVAHDFNNLLTTILGEAALVLDSVETSDTKVRTAIGNIVEAARAASGLTRQMLSYAGRSHTRQAPVDVASIVLDAAALLESSLPRRARLELEVCEQPTLVWADPSQVQQIVMNLAWNAAEACEERGGRVVVRVEPRASREGSPIDAVAIEVLDDGCGMDPATIERASEPFFSTKFQGRGLGLSAVQGIAHFHGGSLQLVSSVGKGSTVTVLLPLLAPDAQARVDALRAAPRGPTAPQGARVLVVDDQSAVAEVAARSLQRFGYATHVVGSGNAALAVLAACDTPFDAILIDRAMPGLSGEETLERLRERDTRIAAVLTSGYDESDSLLAAGRAQPDGFVHKPFTPDELARAIAEALEIAAARQADEDERAARGARDESIN